MPKNGKQNKPRLGRGLSSLMQVEDDPQSPHESTGDAPQASTSGTPMQVSIEAIRPNPSQPRRQFGPAALAELAASMKHAGVIQPLVVRPAPGEDGRFELVAGERRLRAAKLAGLDAVPCVLRSDATDEEQAVAALIENIQREDLNPIDRAEAYDAMRNRLGMTQAEVAERLGEDRSVISNHLRLLDLAPAVRDHVREDRLSLGHAKVLAGVADADLQKQLADRSVEHALSVRNLERLVQSLPAKREKAESPADEQRRSRDLYLQQLADTLGRHVGMKCGIAAGRSGYKLTLHLRNVNEFDTLMAKLGLDAE